VEASAGKRSPEGTTTTRPSGVDDAMEAKGDEMVKQARSRRQLHVLWDRVTSRRACQGQAGPQGYAPCYFADTAEAFKHADGSTKSSSIASQRPRHFARNGRTVFHKVSITCH
jgi:hypothetical protein